MTEKLTFNGSVVLHKRAFMPLTGLMSKNLDYST